MNAACSDEDVVPSDDEIVESDEDSAETSLPENDDRPLDGMLSSGLPTRFILRIWIMRFNV